MTQQLDRIQSVLASLRIVPSKSWRRLGAMRKLCRSYERLAREGGLSRIRAVKNALVDRPLFSLRLGDDAWFWAARLDSAEIPARQFAQDRYIGADFHRALIAALGPTRSPVSVPLPPAWLDLLQEHGLPVSRVRSLARWYWQALLRMCQGMMLIASILGRGLTSRDSVEKTASDAAHLLSLTPTNLPPAAVCQRPYDICSWYANWPGRIARIRRLFHDVPSGGFRKANAMPVQYRPPPGDAAPTGAALLKFTIWGVGACAFAALGLLAGRWWHAMLLTEAAKSKLVSLRARDELAAEYLFAYSANTYRPLWTYAAAEKGSRIILYFYSTYEQIKLPQGYESQKYEWGAANWPRYIVWDEWHAAQLQRDLGIGINVVVAGTIAFSDSGQALPAGQGPRIAVFDVPPFRRLAHFGTSTLADYRHLAPSVDLHFVSDIADALHASGATMLLKQKRDIGNRGLRAYSRMIASLCRLQNVTMVDSAISAARLIASCDAAISVPFTSTALYAREMGIPTVYYDPSNLIDKSDRAAHQIPVLSGPAELKYWIAQLVDALAKQSANKPGMTEQAGGNFKSIEIPTRPTSAPPAPRAS